MTSRRLARVLGRQRQASTSARGPAAGTRSRLGLVTPPELDVERLVRPGDRQQWCDLVLDQRQHQPDRLWVARPMTLTSTAGTAPSPDCRCVGNRRRRCRPAPTSTASTSSTRTHFYVSFNANITVPGLGTVQDEDIVLPERRTGRCSSTARSTARRTTTVTNFDLDAIAIVGNYTRTLYFSTDNNNPPGGGRCRRRRRRVSVQQRNVVHQDGRCQRQRLLGLPAAANVDGLA